jgi:hypothetical protein
MIQPISVALKSLKRAKANPLFLKRSASRFNPDDDFVLRRGGQGGSEGRTGPRQLKRSGFALARFRLALGFALESKRRKNRALVDVEGLRFRNSLPFFLEEEKSSVDGGVYVGEKV